MGDLGVATQSSEAFFFQSYTWLRELDSSTQKSKLNKSFAYLDMYDIKVHGLVKQMCC